MDELHQVITQMHKMYLSNESPSSKQIEQMKRNQKAIQDLIKQCVGYSQRHY